MAHTNYDITVKQGANFERTFTWQDEAENNVDLTGYTARMQVRYSPSSSLLYDASGDLTLGGENGTVVLNIDANTTATFDFDQARYDIILEDENGVVTRLVQGLFNVSKGITRYDAQ